MPLRRSSAPSLNSSVRWLSKVSRSASVRRRAQGVDVDVLRFFDEVDIGLDDVAVGADQHSMTDERDRIIRDRAGVLRVPVHGEGDDSLDKDKKKDGKTKSAAHASLRLRCQAPTKSLLA